MACPDANHEAAAWPRVHVIGIGDDGPQGLAPRELALTTRADLLCGGERHLRLVPEHAAERFTIKSDLDALLAVLEHAPGRRRAVVLASGDPCYFGIAPIIVARLGVERVEVHPHPSSVALAFARLGVGWQDVTVLSAHGRPLETIIAPALAAAKLAVLTDSENTPAAVAGALRDAGMEDAPAWVAEHVGGARERIVKTSLNALANQVFAPLNLLVVLRDPSRVSGATAAAFGRHEDEYLSLRGQITKAEVRAVALSKLEPWRARLAWDVGAGSGSLAIELAALMRRGTVFAVERDRAQIAVLRQNLERHPSPNLRVIHGAAPHALLSLPAPDAVFIGGSGRELRAVLATACLNLAPGGRIVANFAQLETLAIWQAFAREIGWPHELLQISVSRGAAIQDGTRLAPLNPVFITVLTRPEEAAP